MCNPNHNYMHITENPVRQRDSLHFLWGKHLQCRSIKDLITKMGVAHTSRLIQQVLFSHSPSPLFSFFLVLLLQQKLLNFRVTRQPQGSQNNLSCMQLEHSVSEYTWESPYQSWVIGPYLHQALSDVEACTDDVKIPFVLSSLRMLIGGIWGTGYYSTNP